MFRTSHKLVMSALAMAVMCGCTTTVAREGTSLEQTNRDIAECKYEAAKANDNPILAHDLAKQCLALRGYTKQ